MLIRVPGYIVHHHHIQRVCSRALKSLVSFSDATLQLPDGSPIFPHTTFQVRPASEGGYALLGPNGSGKTVLARAIAGQLEVEGRHSETADISFVSFEMHRQFLEQHSGQTVLRALDGLTAASKYLVVRFGLYPLLFRPVEAISTGEIRKVILVKALQSKPDILLLDNAFDGLDVESRRRLSDLISQMIQGFGEMLVQGVSASSTAHTQVVMATHRLEEVVPEVSVVLHVNHGRLINVQTLESLDQLSPTSFQLLPSHPLLHISQSNTLLTQLVELKKVTVERGNTKLLVDVNWEVLRSEHWMLLGPNGAGKSTLIREVTASATGRGTENGFKVSGRVGLVSTELHLDLCECIPESQNCFSVICSGYNDDIWSVICKETWQPCQIQQAKHVANNLGVQHLLQRPFQSLSQGEQKLVLIARAYVACPDVLILDEMCQGLDVQRRAQVLGLMEAIGKTKNCSIIYVTHHQDEWLNCASHVLELKDGKVVFSGKRVDWMGSG